ncbi:MAG: ribonuclease E activity regulator RraA [Firmicutes bacterium]|nr:ribonuclease E activity regulator RraA [Bacillota bacterium]
MFHTADICDAQPDLTSVCELNLVSFGGSVKFSGRIRTVRVFEDNTLVRQAIDKAESGAVLVVDGGASHRCALIGGNLARLAATRKIAGIVLNACIRDVDEVAEVPIGVMAIGSCPRKSRKEGQGKMGEVLQFGGVLWTPGHWLYADRDGVVMTPEAQR